MSPRGNHFDCWIRDYLVVQRMDVPHQEIRRWGFRHAVERSGE
jgi:hypothetical protein